MPFDEAVQRMQQSVTPAYRNVVSSLVNDMPSTMNALEDAYNKNPLMQQAIDFLTDDCRVQEMWTRSYDPKQDRHRRTLDHMQRFFEQFRLHCDATKGTPYHTVSRASDEVMRHALRADILEAMVAQMVCIEWMPNVTFAVLNHFAREFTKRKWTVIAPT